MYFCARALFLRPKNGGLALAGWQNWCRNFRNSAGYRAKASRATEMMLIILAQFAVAKRQKAISDGQSSKSAVPMN
jgi:hypothetical protein